MIDLLVASLLLAQAAPQRAPAAAPAAAFETLARQAAQARDANRMEQALGLYQRALALRPKWDEGWWNAGSIAYDLDLYPQCAAAFRQLTVLKPESAPAWIMSGLCEFQLRNYGIALDSLTHAERARFAAPPELERVARLSYALVLTKHDMYEKAITILTEMVRRDKKTDDVAVPAGIAGLRRPLLPSEVAESEREKVARLGDAMISAMQIDYSAAVSKFESLVTDYPSDANIRFRFGAVLNTRETERSEPAREAPDRGIQEMRKAVELDPAHVPALVSLAVLYLKRDELPAARDFAGKAVKAAPRDFSTHIALGRALLAGGEAASAARELEEAVRLAPGSADAHYNLASAYAQLGRKEEAARQRDQFRQLRKLIDSPQQ